MLLVSLWFEIYELYKIHDSDDLFSYAKWKLNESIENLDDFMRNFDEVSLIRIILS